MAGSSNSCMHSAILGRGELLRRAVGRPLGKGAQDQSKTCSTLPRLSGHGAIALWRVRERERERERVSAYCDGSGSRRRPRGVDSSAERKPDAVSNEANFGVGGDGRRLWSTVFPEGGGTCDRWGEFIWRSEKYAGRLARLRLFLVFDVTVDLSFSGSRDKIGNS